MLATALIADQVTLVRLLSRGDPLLSREAIAELTGEAVLEKVAKNENEVVRECALENPHLTDEEIVAAAALTDPSLAVRKVAVARLTDPEILAKVASSEKDDALRAGAALQLTLWNPLIDRHMPRLIVTVEESPIYFQCLTTQQRGGSMPQSHTDSVSGTKVSVTVSLRTEPALETEQRSPLRMRRASLHSRPRDASSPHRN